MGAKKKYFTIIYSFMSADLRLRANEMIIFSIIFNFWFHIKKPVAISFSRMQKISGATRKTVISAVQALEDLQLITVNRRDGQTNCYAVTIDQKILAEFASTYRPVEYLHRGQSKFETSTSGKTQPQNNNIINLKESTPNTNYVIAGGLREI